MGALPANSRPAWRILKGRIILTPDERDGYGKDDMAIAKFRPLKILLQ